MSLCTFDGANKIVILNNGVSAIQVIQIYSEWKNWALSGDNSKYLQAFSNVGGESLPGGKKLGSTYFLLNGWKIRPYEGDQTLTVDGNLYCEDGSSPYIKTIGNYNVAIISNISALTYVSTSTNTSALTQAEHDKLMSLNNIDTIALIDAIWDKVLPNGVPVKDYITYKLLTTNKFIGLS